MTSQSNTSLAKIQQEKRKLQKVKTSQEDSNKSELEKYKQLYLKELNVRKLLSEKVNKTDEHLAEISTKFLMEKQQNRYLVSTLPTRSVLEPSCVGNLNNHLVLNRNLIPRANLVIPSSSPQPSNSSMETYLTKMQQQLEKNVARELQAAAVELESGCCRASPLGSTNESNLNQDLVLKTLQVYVPILKRKFMI
ncbi:ankyrin repeat domain-containing protein 26-like [Choloepus didactylus]|uniref:ankyrin repeat domain-containing protein 26-like n=1 Tax=Choloepus didactylus TaxID=27675 RepID=UPI0018A0DD8A|nr:ankyrin repeat domain-containing protein 26-like [Choloepus didactylus]